MPTFSLPDRTAYPTKFADYLEFCALCSPTRYVPVNLLLSGFAFEEDEEVQDWAEEDAEMEGVLISVQDVLSGRQERIGKAYPFQISQSGLRLEFSGIIDDDTCLYLFLLILSHASDRTIVAEIDAPQLTNEVRNWFQSLSTVAAGGFIQGTSVSFGWPRPDRTGFAAALGSTYARFGEGRPLDKPRPAAPKRIKDGGIDIIAWRQSIDGLAGKLYLVGQVASGENWDEKSVKQHAQLFHKFWFFQAPASEHKSSMFMPFALEPKDPSDPECEYEMLISDYAQMLTDEFGDVFYRDRIAHFALVGKELINAGNSEIDGAQALPQIRAWVQEKVSALCGEPHEE